MNIKSVRKRISTVVLGVGTAALASACSVGEATSEDLAETQEPFVYVANGACATHIQIAAEIIRTAMIDLGRYNPGLDLVKGPNGVVILTAGGEARCASRLQKCARLKSLLSYQTISWQTAQALTPDFPYFQNFQGMSIANAIASSMSDYQWPNPNQVMSHSLTYSHTMAAPAVTNCGLDLKYHCFNVADLPAGKTATDLAAQIKGLFTGSNLPIANFTRIFADSNNKLCIDPDGIGDDQTGGGSTGGSTCTDGTMAIAYDAALIGSCCTKPAGTGYLVSHASQPQYMQCKMTDAAATKPVTASSGSSPGNVTDADMNSVWTAATAGVGQSAAIALGAATTVKGVVVKFGTVPAAGQSYGYKVETSANGTSWVQRKTGTSATQTTDVNLVPAVTGAQHVRVTLTALPSGVSAASLASVKVFTD